MKQKIVVACVGTCLSLMLGEFSIRIFRREFFTTSNLIRRNLGENKKSSPYSGMDAQLGWALPKDSKKVHQNLLETRLSGPVRRPFVVSTQEGLRITPNSWNNKIDGNSTAIALGDSFTFGGEVNDEETWPAHFQALTEMRVLNGGVSLYGLDQSLLRLKQLLETARPEIVVLSVIEESIKRTCRKKERLSGTGEWVERPYFVIRSGKLDLQNVPQRQSLSRKGHLSGVRSWLGRSHLADFVFGRIAFKWWHGVYWGKPIPEKYLTSENPREISCLILSSFLELSRKHKFQPVVLGQYYWKDPYQPFRSEPLTQEVLQCAKTLGILTVDLEGPLKHLAENSPEEYNTLYFPGAHMTNRGNLWVATQLANILQMKW